jgi:hypothetical protein
VDGVDRQTSRSSSCSSALIRDMGDYTSLTLITSLRLSFVLLSISVQSSLQTWCPSYDSCSGDVVRVSSCSGC